MKAEILAVFATTMIGVSPMSAQAKFQVAEVDQILMNPDLFEGKTIALHGIVGTAALEERTFTVLDSKSSSPGGANARFVRVTFPERSQMVIPRPGQEIVVIGQIQKRLGGTRSVATQVFTNPADVHQMLAQGSIARKPGRRPGDNLGRDAHPADDSQ
jgi:hypothetical protein